MPKTIFEIRPSSIQGMGAFASRFIRKGTRIIEYTGERITPAEADRRYNDDESEHPQVLLFSVNRRTVIDAGVGGNAARFINHSCEPNCETVTQEKRIYVEALRDIKKGEELCYDYNLTRDGDDTYELEQRYACHCGVKTCRGTMLKPLPPMRRSRQIGR
jgi:hypothetical protein